MIDYIEAAASTLGLSSVVLSIFKYVWVYPVGMVSTIAYIFIMVRAQLYGDALVNVVYTFMSAYGWYQWSQNAEEGKITARMATWRERSLGLMMYVSGIVVIWAIYTVVGQPMNWLDVFSSSLFAVAMWLMAQQCVDSWYLWFIGDMVSIAKTARGGLYFTSGQYFILTGMAVWGGYEWWLDAKRGSSMYRGV